MMGHDELAERHLLGSALLFDFDVVREFAQVQIARLGADAFTPGARRALAQLAIAGAHPRDVFARLDLRREAERCADVCASRMYTAITDAARDVATACSRRALLREAVRLAGLAMAADCSDVRTEARRRLVGVEMLDAA